MHTTFDTAEFNESGDSVVVGTSRSTNWSVKVGVGNQASTTWSVQVRIGVSQKTSWSVDLPCTLMRVAATDLGIHSAPARKVASAIQAGYLLVSASIEESRADLLDANNRLVQLSGANDPEAHVAAMVVNAAQSRLDALIVRKRELMGQSFQGAFVANSTYCTMLAQQAKLAKRLN